MHFLWSKTLGHYFSVSYKKNIQIFLVESPVNTKHNCNLKSLSWTSRLNTKVMKLLWAHYISILHYRSSRGQNMKKIHILYYNWLECGFLRRNTITYLLPRENTKMLSVQRILNWIIINIPLATNWSTGQGFNASSQISTLSVFSLLTQSRCIRSIKSNYRILWSMSTIKKLPWQSQAVSDISSLSMPSTVFPHNNVIK